MAMDLAVWLDTGWKDYQETWAMVDEELHDLCHRRGHERFEDVYTKVVIVNRVYMVGITRVVRAEGLRDGPEAAVARALLGMKDVLTESLQRLTPVDDLTAVTMSQIVEVHGLVTNNLAAQLQGANLRSFVSKYLHFHCPMVPIYDSLAASAVTKALSPHVHGWTRTRDLLERPTHFDGVYYWYAGRFLELWRLVHDVHVRPDASVKMIDHALWNLGKWAAAA